MAVVSIDLRKAHLSRQYGDITAVYSWINDGRALFLIPSYRKGAPWFIVMEPAAHEWDDHDAQNVMQVAHRAVKACEVLGIEPTPQNARRIVSIVNDAIPDLVRMPSAPPTEYYSASHGQMLLRADGVPLAAEEIRIEKQGATYG